MNRAVLFLLTLFLAPTLTSAQNPIVEIGTSLGVTRFSNERYSATRFSVPGQGILGQPTLYASFFAHDALTGGALMLEPQLALNVLSSDGQTTTTVGVGGQVGYLVQGVDVNSPFLAIDFGFQSTSGGGASDNDFAVGAKVGYRIPIGTGFALRLEGGYRRWLDSDLNELSIGISIGGIIRRSR